LPKANFEKENNEENKKTGNRKENIKIKKKEQNDPHKQGLPLDVLDGMRKK
jgi:hypothetical protein